MCKVLNEGLLLPNGLRKDKDSNLRLSLFFVFPALLAMDKEAHSANPSINFQKSQAAMKALLDVQFDTHNIDALKKFVGDITKARPPAHTHTW